MPGQDGMGMAGAGGAPDAGDGMDLDSLLGGTSPEGDPTSGLQGGFPGQGADLTGAQAEAYRFAGRTWKGGQREAEGAWNKLYGQYSEQKGLINALKSADPETLAILSRDPKIAQIMAKFGIEAAGQELQDDPRMQQRDEMGPEDFRRELGIERRQNQILREEWTFERKMGRPLTEKESQAVYKQLERSENLTYEEAYFLAHREQLLKRQAQGAASAASGQPSPASGNGRPKPPPRSMPGTPAPGKKSVGEMSEQEWKDNLRQSGIVKELMSRGLSSR